MDVERAARNDVLGFRRFPHPGALFVMTVVLSRWYLLHSLLWLSLILLVSLAAPLAAQQEPAGRVTVVLGSVEAESADGDRRSLGRGDSVFEGDTLQSGPRGRAQIRFSDGGMMSLRPDSALSLDSYQNSAASPASSRQEMSLRRGGFRAQTGRVAQANRQGYRVQTPVAVIGIRGTVFDVHQEVSGALLVGTSRGGIEVESSAGVIGRIGAGESFDYLRVNPDGSIDFLLEVPEAFTVSPELTARGEDDELDAGGVEQSSVNTGDGASESTAGIAIRSGDQLVDVTNDPESAGTVSPSRQGSGEQPLIPGSDVLDDGQVETLLTDDRVGVAVGVPSVTVDANGELVIGSPTLQGGIATFNSPLLALSSARAGFGAGLASSARTDLLAETDLLLLPDSAESESDQNVAGVPGLIWGRYLAPVSLFFDPADDSAVLQLERDILFMLGTPSDIATLEGQHQFSVTDFDAVTSGLPVNEIAGGGVLDVTNARYSGFLDILLGAETATEGSLLAEFAADVQGGVLEGIEFGRLDLFDFETESSMAAEGELAGFFTGDAAAFLQLAFDFRVPSRDDADVAGLVLLARANRVLSEAQRSALLGNDAVALALGVEPSGLQATEAGEGVLARGIGSVDDGAPVLVFDSAATGLSGAERAAQLAGADALFTADSGEFTLDENVEGSGVTWGSFSAPVTQFLDDADADAVLALDRNLLFVIGTPMDVANRQGAAFYELRAATGDSSGLPLLGFESRAALDFDTGSLFGFLQANFGTETVVAEIMADFSASVEAGVLGGVEFQAVEFFDFTTEQATVADADLAGFLAGDSGAFLQLAFDLRVPGRNDADVSGLALLSEVQEVAGAALTAGEFFALQEDRFFVAVNCCFIDDGRPTRTIAGRVTDPAPSAGEGAVLAYSVDDVGNPIAVSDPRFGEILPDRVVRRDGALVAFFDEDPNAGLAAFEWDGSEAPAGIYDSVEGNEVGQFTRNLMVLTGRPTQVADLIGFRRYETVELVQGFFRTSSAATPRTPLPSAEMSFNVNFADGRVTDGLFEAPLSPEFGGVIGGEPGTGGQVSLAGPTMVAIFEGQVTTDGEHAFVDFDVTDGGIPGEFGEVVDPLNLEASFIEGFFTGPSAERFAAAFHLQATGFGDDPILAVGNMLLEQQDLSLTAAELGLFNDAPYGYVAAGTGPAAVGQAVLDGQQVVFGLNAGGPGQADFLAIPPTQLLRNPGSETFLLETGQFDALVAAPIRQGIWFGEPSPILRVRAEDGEILERISDRLYYQLALPVDVATLQAAGFTTFAGTNLGGRAGPVDHLGFTALDSTIAGIHGSFNIDLASGDLFAGHLFVADTFEPQGDFLLIEEGFEIDFEGTVAFDGNGSFVMLDLLEGTYQGRTPLDLEASSIEGFFTGGQDGVVFAGNYALQTQALDGTDPAVAGGVFSFANVLEVEPGFFVQQEQRLTRIDAESWKRVGSNGESRPGFALAALRVLQGKNMVMLGRGGPVATGGHFVLGANQLNLHDPDGFLIGDTRRADFLGQPFDFVLTQETSFGNLAAEETELFDADARPVDAPNFDGFEVSWGAWSNSGADAPPRVLTDPQNPDASLSTADETYFASVNPTPTAQIPRQGVFSYGGAADFIGGGRGDLSRFNQSRLSDLQVGFLLDFGSGAISDGTIRADYDLVRWDGAFEGQLNGPITDLQLTSLALLQESSGEFFNVGTGDLEVSNVTGLLTGPEAQRHAGAFNFYYEGLSGIETAEGLWVIDQVQEVLR